MLRFSDLAFFFPLECMLACDSLYIFINKLGLRFSVVDFLFTSVWSGLRRIRLFIAQAEAVA